VRRTRFHDRLPELVAEGGIGEEDLVPDLAGPAGAADHDRDARDGRIEGPVVLHAGDGPTDQLPHQVFGLRALHLQGVGLGQRDGGVQAPALREAHRIQVGVAVGQAQPEGVFIAAQQHRVVDDAAIGGDDRRVLALSGRAFGEVAAGQRVGQREAIGPADLHHPLDSDIPQGDVVDQRPVLRDQVVVVGGQVHVVVHVVGLAAPP